MQTNNEGGENKEPKAPGTPPVESTPQEKKPGPDAGKDKKDEGEEKNVTAEALTSAAKTLEAAERRIVELKRELKARGQGGEGGEMQEIRDLIANLSGQVEELKSQSVPKDEQDKTLSELQEARKKLGEVSAALLSKNTMGKGEGEGGNKQPLQPAHEPKALATTPEEIAVLARRGMDKYGKKINK